MEDGFYWVRIWVNGALVPETDWTVAALQDNVWWLIGDERSIPNDPDRMHDDSLKHGGNRICELGERVVRPA